jgi:putative transposase
VGYSLVMTDTVDRRCITYKLYPTAAQLAEMERICDLHCQLYNAALQERIEAYRRASIHIGYHEQAKSLTVIRREFPEYAAINAQSQQNTLKRLDRAFVAFFRRCKAGEKPGFPRFKSRDRYPGWGYTTHGNGFCFTHGDNWRHGKLYLSGIGTMSARGVARTPGRIVCADICRKTDGWFLSLVVECEPHREHTGDLHVGLDWGVETFATLCYGPYKFAKIPNDRLFAQEQEKIRQAQRVLSKALRGKRSKRADRAKRLLRKRSRHLVNRRKDRSHQTTACLVRQHAVIITEKLSINNMTASAKGTAKKPGKNVRQKATLNRAILDTAPGSWLQMLSYKAEEAATRLILVDPLKYRPSQTDPISGVVRKKTLSERTHILPDGTVIGRDQAAAWVLWNIGQDIIGSERAAAARLETVNHSSEVA